MLLLTRTVNAANHTKYISLFNRKCEINILLSIYILMNTVKNDSSIPVQLN